MRCCVCQPFLGLLYLVIATVSSTTKVTNLQNHADSRDADPYLAIIEKVANSLSPEYFQKNHTLLQVNDAQKKQTSYELVTNSSASKNDKSSSIVFLRNVSDVDKNIIVISLTKNKPGNQMTTQLDHFYVVLKKKPAASQPLYFYTFAIIRNATAEDKNTFNIGGIRSSIEWPKTEIKVGEKPLSATGRRFVGSTVEVRQGGKRGEISLSQRDGMPLGYVDVDVPKVTSTSDNRITSGNFHLGTNPTNYEQQTLINYQPPINYQQQSLINYQPPINYQQQSQINYQPAINYQTLMYPNQIYQYPTEIYFSETIRVRRQINETNADPYIIIIEKATSSLPLEQFLSKNILLQVVDEQIPKTSYKLPTSKSENEVDNINEPIYVRNVSDKNKPVVVIPVTDKNKLQSSVDNINGIFVILRKNPAVSKPLYHFTFACIRNATKADKDAIAVGDSNIRIEWGLQFQVGKDSGSQLPKKPSGRFLSFNAPGSFGNTGAINTLLYGNQNPLGLSGIMTNLGLSLAKQQMNKVLPQKPKNPFSFNFPSNILSSFSDILATAVGKDSISYKPPTFFPVITPPPIANWQQFDELSGTFSPLDKRYKSVRAIIIPQRGIPSTLIVDSRPQFAIFSPWPLPTDRATEGSFISIKYFTHSTEEGFFVPNVPGFPALFIKKSEGIRGIFKPSNGGVEFKGFYISPGRFLPENLREYSQIFAKELPSRFTFLPDAPTNGQKLTITVMEGKVLPGYLHEPPMFIAKTQGSFGVLNIAPDTKIKGTILNTYPVQFLPDVPSELEKLVARKPIKSTWEPEAPHGPYPNKTEGVLYPLSGVKNPVFKSHIKMTPNVNASTLENISGVNSTSSKITPSMPSLENETESNPTSAKENPSISAVNTATTTENSISTPANSTSKEKSDIPPENPVSTKEISLSVPANTTSENESSNTPAMDPAPATESTISNPTKIFPTNITSTPEIKNPIPDTVNLVPTPPNQDPTPSVVPDNPTTENPTALKSNPTPGTADPTPTSETPTPAAENQTSGSTPYSQPLTTKPELGKTTDNLNATCPESLIKNSTSGVFVTKSTPEINIQGYITESQNENNTKAFISINLELTTFLEFVPQVIGTFKPDLSICNSNQSKIPTTGKLIANPGGSISFTSENSETVNGNNTADTT